MLKFWKQKESKQIEIPILLKPDDPVNYDAVLDWLLGLSTSEYQKMIKIVETYREAKKAEAKILKVKDEPTTQLISDKPSEQQIDADLDQLLMTDSAGLAASIEAADIPTLFTEQDNKRVSKPKHIEVEDRGQ